MTHAPSLSLLSLALCAAPALAQDSVSVTGGLPGDAVSPYDDGGSPFGTEQCDAFVVELNELFSSWGNRFGAAPLLKSTRTGPQFFDNLMSGNGMSRLQALGVPYPSAVYEQWAGAGPGINNDPAINSATTPVSKSGHLGHQFGVAFSEFGTPGASYNGIVGAVVNVSPLAPEELFVTRRTAAINGCDGDADYAQFGFGSIDETGQLLFRADAFGTTGGGCGLSTLGSLTADPSDDDSVFRVATLARDCAIRNVISDETVALTGTGTDFGATATIVPYTHPASGPGGTLNTPTMIPSSVTGGLPVYLGTNFRDEFVRGSSIGTLQVDGSHLASGVASQRGNLSYCSHDFDFLGSSCGTAGILGRTPAGEATILNLFGVDCDGDVTGTRAYTLPTGLTDPTTGFTVPGAEVEFVHYFSQVPFRGGNGQIALGRDQQGRLLAAATADYPGPGDGSAVDQFIAVLRADPTTGAGAWTVAAYNGGLGTGKPILGGPGGPTIGRLVSFAQNPGVGVPMLDSVGNVWFVGAIELDTAPGETDVALLRAVYDPAGFDYELELVLGSGTTLPGLNSARDYTITFLELSDSNSIDSGSPFSQNVSQVAHLSQDPAGLATSDPRTLGGLVLSLVVHYDYDEDGSLCTASGSAGDPLCDDQDYQVLFYVGALDPGTDVDGNGVADEAEMLSSDTLSVSVAAGGSQSFDLQAGIENAGLAFLLVGSVSGTSPGFTFNGVDVPLNIDFYTILGLNNPNQIPLPVSFGTLDAQGQATALFQVPGGLIDPSLVGTTAHHAFGVLDFTVPGLLVEASNPWPLDILP